MGHTQSSGRSAQPIDSLDSSYVYVQSPHCHRAIVHPPRTSTLSRSTELDANRGLTPQDGASSSGGTERAIACDVTEDFPKEGLSTRSRKWFLACGDSLYLSRFG